MKMSSNKYLFYTSHACTSKVKQNSEVTPNSTKLAFIATFLYFFLFSRNKKGMIYLSVALMFRHVHYDTYDHVHVDGWTAEWVIIASNVNSVMPTPTPPPSNTQFFRFHAIFRQIWQNCVDSCRRYLGKILDPPLYHIGYKPRHLSLW